MIKTRHPLWTRYNGMIARCNNPKNISFHNYGAKGIKVCSRWMESFEAFVEDMGLPNVGQSLDRIDSNKDYGPDNCRWATRAEQQRNTKRNVWIEVAGETKTVRDWEINNGVKRGAYQRRIDLGWDHVQAVTQPFMPGKSLRRRT